MIKIKQRASPWEPNDYSINQWKKSAVLATLRKRFTHTVHCSSRGFQGYQRLPSQRSISHLFTLPSCSCCNTSKHGWIPNASGDTYTKDSKHFHFRLLLKCVASATTQLLAIAWGISWYRQKTYLGQWCDMHFFLLIHSNIYKNRNSHIR